MKKIYTFLITVCLLTSFQALSFTTDNEGKKRSPEDNQPTQTEVEPEQELDNFNIQNGQANKDPSIFWQDNLNHGRAEIREAHSKH